MQRHFPFTVKRIQTSFLAILFGPLLRSLPPYGVGFRCQQSSLPQHESHALKLLKLLPKSLGLPKRIRPPRCTVSVLHPREVVKVASRLSGAHQSIQDTDVARESIPALLRMLVQEARGQLGQLGVRDLSCLLQACDEVSSYPEASILHMLAKAVLEVKGSRGKERGAPMGPDASSGIISDPYGTADLLRLLLSISLKTLPPEEHAQLRHYINYALLSLVTGGEPRAAASSGKPGWLRLGLTSHHAASKKEKEAASKIARSLCSVGALDNSGPLMAAVLGLTPHDLDPSITRAKILLHQIQDTRTLQQLSSLLGVTVRANNSKVAKTAAHFKKRTSYSRQGSTEVENRTTPSSSGAAEVHVDRTAPPFRSQQGLEASQSWLDSGTTDMAGVPPTSSHQGHEIYQPQLDSGPTDTAGVPPTSSHQGHEISQPQLVSSPIAILRLEATRLKHAAWKSQQQLTNGSPSLPPSPSPSQSPSPSASSSPSPSESSYSSSLLPRLVLGPAALQAAHLFKITRGTKGIEGSASVVAFTNTCTILSLIHTNLALAMDLRLDHQSPPSTHSSPTFGTVNHAQNNRRWQPIHLLPVLNALNQVLKASLAVGYVPNATLLQTHVQGLLHLALRHPAPSWGDDLEEKDRLVSAIVVQLASVARLSARSQHGSPPLAQGLSGPSHLGYALGRDGGDHHASRELTYPAGPASTTNGGASCPWVFLWPLLAKAAPTMESEHVAETAASLQQLYNQAQLLHPASLTPEVESARKDAMSSIVHLFVSTLSTPNTTEALQPHSNRTTNTYSANISSTRSSAAGYTEGHTSPPSSSTLTPHSITDKARYNDHMREVLRSKGYGGRVGPKEDGLDGRQCSELSRQNMSWDDAALITWSASKARVAAPVLDRLQLLVYKFGLEDPSGLQQPHAPHRRPADRPALTATGFAALVASYQSHVAKSCTEQRQQQTSPQGALQPNSHEHVAEDRPSPIPVKLAANIPTSSAGLRSPLGEALLIDSLATLSSIYINQPENSLSLWRGTVAQTWNRDQTARVIKWVTQNLNSNFEGQGQPSAVNLALLADAISQQPRLVLQGSASCPTLQHLLALHVVSKAPLTPLVQATAPLASFVCAQLLSPSTLDVLGPGPVAAVCMNLASWQVMRDGALCAASANSTTRASVSKPLELPLLLDTVLVRLMETTETQAHETDGPKASCQRNNSDPSGASADWQAGPSATSVSYLGSHVAKTHPSKAIERLVALTEEITGRGVMIHRTFADSPCDDKSHINSQEPLLDVLWACASIRHAPHVLVQQISAERQASLVAASSQCSPAEGCSNQSAPAPLTPAPAPPIQAPSPPTQAPSPPTQAPPPPTQAPSPPTPREDPSKLKTQTSETQSPEQTSAPSHSCISPLSALLSSLATKLGDPNFAIQFSPVLKLLAVAGAPLGYKKLLEGSVASLTNLTNMQESSRSGFEQPTTASPATLASSSINILGAVAAATSNDAHTSTSMNASVGIRIDTTSRNSTDTEASTGASTNLNTSPNTNTSASWTVGRGLKPILSSHLLPHLHTLSPGTLSQLAPQLSLLGLEEGGPEGVLHQLEKYRSSLSWYEHQGMQDDPQHRALLKVQRQRLHSLKSDWPELLSVWSLLKTSASDLQMLAALAEDHVHVPTSSSLLLALRSMRAMDASGRSKALVAAIAKEIEKRRHELDFLSSVEAVWALLRSDHPATAAVQQNAIETARANSVLPHVRPADVLSLLQASCEAAASAVSDISPATVEWAINAIAASVPQGEESGSSSEHFLYGVPAPRPTPPRLSSSVDSLRTLSDAISVYYHNAAPRFIRTHPMSGAGRAHEAALGAAQKLLSGVEAVQKLQEAGGSRLAIDLIGVDRMRELVRGCALDDRYAQLMLPSLRAAMMGTAAGGSSMSNSNSSSYISNYNNSSNSSKISNSNNSSNSSNSSNSNTSNTSNSSNISDSNNSSSSNSSNSSNSNSSSSPTSNGVTLQLSPMRAQPSPTQPSPAQPNPAQSGNSPTSHSMTLDLWLEHSPMHALSPPQLLAMSFDLSECLTNLAAYSHRMRDSRALSTTMPPGSTAARYGYPQVNIPGGLGTLPDSASSSGSSSMASSSRGSSGSNSRELVNGSAGDSLLLQCVHGVWDLAGTMSSGANSTSPADTACGAGAAGLDWPLRRTAVEAWDLYFSALVSLQPRLHQLPPGMLPDAARLYATAMAAASGTLGTSGQLGSNGGARRSGGGVGTTAGESSPHMLMQMYRKMLAIPPLVWEEASTKQLQQLRASSRHGATTPMQHLPAFAALNLSPASFDRLVEGTIALWLGELVALENSSLFGGGALGGGDVRGGLGLGSRQRPCAPIIAWRGSEWDKRTLQISNSAAAAVDSVLCVLRNSPQRHATRARDATLADIPDRVAAEERYMDQKSGQFRQQYSSQYMEQYSGQHREQYSGQHMDQKSGQYSGQNREQYSGLYMEQYMDSLETHLQPLLPELHLTALLSLLHSFASTIKHLELQHAQKQPSSCTNHGDRTSTSTSTSYHADDPNTNTNASISTQTDTSTEAVLSQQMLRHQKQHLSEFVGDTDWDMRTEASPPQPMWMIDSLARELGDRIRVAAQLGPARYDGVLNRSHAPLSGGGDILAEGKVVQILDTLLSLGYVDKYVLESVSSALIHSSSPYTSFPYLVAVLERFAQFGYYGKLFHYTAMRLERDQGRGNRTQSYPAAYRSRPQYDIILQPDLCASLVHSFAMVGAPLPTLPLEATSSWAAPPMSHVLPERSLRLPSWQYMSWGQLKPLDTSALVKLICCGNLFGFGGVDMLLVAGSEVVCRLPGREQANFSVAQVAPLIDTALQLLHPAIVTRPDMQLSSPNEATATDAFPGPDQDTHVAESRASTRGLVAESSPGTGGVAALIEGGGHSEGGSGLISKADLLRDEVLVDMVVRLVDVLGDRASELAVTDGVLLLWRVASVLALEGEESRSRSHSHSHSGSDSTQADHAHVAESGMEGGQVSEDLLRTVAGVSNNINSMDGGSSGNSSNSGSMANNINNINSSNSGTWSSKHATTSAAQSVPCSGKGSLRPTYLRLTDILITTLHQRITAVHELGTDAVAALRGVLPACQTLQHLFDSAHEGLDVDVHHPALRSKLQDLLSIVSVARTASPRDISQNLPQRIPGVHPVDFELPVIHPVANASDVAQPGIKLAASAEDAAWPDVNSAFDSGELPGPLAEAAKPSLISSYKLPFFNSELWSPSSPLASPPSPPDPDYPILPNHAPCHPPPLTLEASAIMCYTFMGRLADKDRDPAGVRAPAGSLPRVVGGPPGKGGGNSDHGEGQYVVHHPPWDRHVELLSARSRRGEDVGEDVGGAPETVEGSDERFVGALMELTRYLSEFEGPGGKLQHGEMLHGDDGCGTSLEGGGSGGVSGRGGNGRGVSGRGGSGSSGPGVGSDNRAGRMGVADHLIQVSPASCAFSDEGPIQSQSVRSAEEEETEAHKLPAADPTSFQPPTTTSNYLRGLRGPNPGRLNRLSQALMESMQWPEEGQQAEVEK